MEPNFTGWATVSNVKCSDGRTIMPDAFKHQDKIRVPLVWQHQHNEPENVLGYAILTHTDKGVRAKGYFNDTVAGQTAKQVVEHGDVVALSIFANNLVEKNKNVTHGNIRELSLVLAGANPGAFIDNVNITHGEDDDSPIVEAVIYNGVALEHADDDSDDEGPTVQEVFDSMNEQQKTVVYALLGEALESTVEHSDLDEDDEQDQNDQNDTDDAAGDDELTHGNQEDKDMTQNRNVFEGDAGKNDGPHLSHAQLMTLVADAKKMGSFKEAFLSHAEDYGITNIEMLFPDATLVEQTPEWITRRMEWVGPVINGARHLPYARIKSRSADLTHEEARAKGYIKASLKKEQFFTLTQRETTPTTIYKKQKLDRDDIVDITDFDIVAWIWQEMRFMLNEEIARAVLIGDGREVDDEDKINESKIRPIAHDDPFYTDVLVVPTNASGSDLVEAVLRGRENYKGSGDPTAFVTRAVLNDMLLQKDKMGRRLYRNKAELAAELEVSNIITVPILEDASTDDGDLLMILVNMSDYSIGTDKGGQITTFDDFDIDYNQYKYLIEGRMSGALTSHKSAQVVVRTSGTLATPTVPGFVPATGVVTIPTVTGVQYYNQDTDVLLVAGAQTALAAGDTLSVDARPATGYFFAHNTDTDWDFTRPEA